MQKLSILDLPDSVAIKLLSECTQSITPWYKELWDNILTIKDIIFSWFRDAYIGIKNIFIYAPVIYHTREWDYDYLLDLISFKLKRMRNDMLSEQLIMDYANVIKTMQEVIDNIYVYKNSLEVYEDTHQSELQAIIDEKNKDTREKMTSQLYVNMNDFENESFEKIWSNVSKNMRTWWS